MTEKQAGTPKAAPGRPDQWVYLLDDDRSVREGVSALLEAGGYGVRVFSAPRDLRHALERCDDQPVLLVDVRLVDANGLDFLSELQADGIKPVAVVMTAYADLPTAVRAIRADVVDFLEKPFARDQLFAAMERAFARIETAGQDHSGRRAELANRYSALSPRECEVFAGMVAGQPSKMIARHLGISPRTVEVHRSNVLHKMEAASLVDLVHMANTLGLSNADGASGDTTS